MTLGLPPRPWERPQAVGGDPTHGLWPEFTNGESADQKTWFTNLAMRAGRAAVILSA